MPHFASIFHLKKGLKGDQGLPGEIREGPKGNKGKLN